MTCEENWKYYVLAKLIYTHKLLVNFTNNHKEMASTTLNWTCAFEVEKLKIVFSC